MKPTITIEIPADSEALVRRLLALHEELAQLALAAAKDTSAARRQQCFWTALLKRPPRPSTSSAA